MEIEVIKFDNLGRGIGYLNNKIIFIPKSVPGDIVKVKIVKEKKNYFIGHITEIIKKSKMRKDAICPYFANCGGCDLLHISTSESLEYKINKINELLQQNKIDYQVNNIIKSKEQFYYRNKVTLKIVNNKIGFYESESHNLIEINYCYLCHNIINEIIKDINILEIHNGLLTIRVNYNNEVLLLIETKDKILNIEKLCEKYKIVGIINNNELIYGEDYFIDKIDNYLFKVSYDSFFQVNPFICKELFKLIKENTKDSSNILDLYCGVGTLGIVASNKNHNVLGVEIVQNAVRDAFINKNLNQITNAEFLCSDTKEIINKITNNFDTIIMDPPRSGVNKEVIQKIMACKIKKIIYVSCDPSTLVRDLKILKDQYYINNITLLDMFPNTEHVESVCVLLFK